MNKAYKIHLKVYEYKDDFVIVSAKNAGRAKTIVINGLREQYLYENYSCITYCRRSYEYDPLAQKWDGYIAWKQGRENWEQDKGHWFE